MGKIEKFEAEVSQKKFLTEKVCFVRLSLLAPRRIKFLPGQFISLQVAKGARRSYSICSWPPQADFIELIADVSPGGLGSQFFQKVRVGKKVSFLGPMGKFILKEEADAVFLATGTGVAPFKPMICEKLKVQSSKFKVYLYLGFRYEEDVFWREYFEGLERKHPNFHFTLTLSRPAPNWKGKSGYIQQHLKPPLTYASPTSVLNRPKALKRKSNLCKTDYYICGGRSMMQGVIAFLQEKGVKRERIFCEKY